MYNKSPSPPNIQFRAGDLLTKWIAKRGKAWNVSPNEAARRLTALAVTCLDLDPVHGQFVELAEASRGEEWGGQQFIRGCEQVRLAVEYINRARAEMGKQPLNQEERLQFVRRTVGELTQEQLALREEAEQVVES